MQRLCGFLFVAVACVALTPSRAAADYWQQGEGGYWYYWSDAKQTWYYQTGGDTWLVYQNGAWVPTASTRRAAAAPEYRSYYPSGGGVGGSVGFPTGGVSWGPGGGQVSFPGGAVSWGRSGYVVFPFGSVSWGR